MDFQIYEHEDMVFAYCATDLNTNIDIIITNINYGKAGTYESFFSYHKPIYFYLNDLKLSRQVKSKKIVNNDVLSIQFLLNQ